MVKQFSLFINAEDKSAKTSETDSNTTELTEEAILSVYILHDKKLNIYYVGVSKEPYGRYQAYLSKKHKNRKLIKAMTDHPKDIEFTIIEEFFDPYYKRNDPKCRGVQVESFLMDFYNSILNGYNKSRMFTHDYHDIEFWSEILPPKVLEYFNTSDHNLLNDRANRTATTPYRTRNNPPKNKEIYDWTVEYILDLEKRGIPVQVLAKRMDNIHHSNLYRYIKGTHRHSVSVKRIYQFLRNLENELELLKRPDPILKITKI